MSQPGTLKTEEPPNRREATRPEEQGHRRADTSDQEAERRHRNEVE